LRDDPRCIEEFAIVLVVGANMASLPTIGRVVRAACHSALARRAFLNASEN